MSLLFVHNQHSEINEEFYNSLAEKLYLKKNFLSVFLFWKNSEISSNVKLNKFQRNTFSFENFYKDYNSKKQKSIEDFLKIYPEINWSQLISSERAFTDYSMLLGSSGNRKESLEYMKSYNIKNHPVSQVKIPDYIFENIKCKETNQELTLDEKALQVFQLFTNLSIFIDYKKFLSLNKKKLLTFNYETRDFYYQNFSESDRKIIDEKDGKQYFSLQNNELEKKSDDNIKLYLLNQIEQVLSCKDNNLKFMINYILLGGLSIVIEEVKEYYNNFNFSF